MGLLVVAPQVVGALVSPTGCGGVVLPGVPTTSCEPSLVVLACLFAVPDTLVVPLAYPAVSGGILLSGFNTVALYPDPPCVSQTVSFVQRVPIIDQGRIT